MQKADNDTYTLLINKEYKKMILVGKDALNNGIDFYYLQLRMGIAYYELKNYEQAIPYFYEAKKRNISDTLNLEYLYFSYLFSNRVEEAALLAESFSPSMQNKVGYKKQFLEKISTDVGMLYTNNYNKYRDYDFLGTDKKAMKGIFYSDVYYASLLLENKITPRISLKNSLSYYNNTKNDIFQVKRQNGTINSQIFTDKNSLFQYNLVASAYLGKGWKAYFGGGIYYSQYVVNIMPPQSVPPLPIKSEDRNVTQYSASLSMSKRWKFVEPTFSLNFGKLSDSTNTKSAEIGLTYYPFGNTNFYGHTSFAAVATDTMRNAILTQSFGTKIYKNIWSEVNASIGNHNNYISNNGLYVYNTPEPILWNSSIGLNYYRKKMDFSIKYSIQQRGTRYDIAYLNGNLTFVPYQYLYHGFQGKVAWRF